MAREITEHTNRLDYTQDLINIVWAIDSVKIELNTLNKKMDEQNAIITDQNTILTDQNTILTNQNALIQEIIDILTSMDATHAEYLLRAATETLGIYTRSGIFSGLSRALVMSAIDQDRLQDLIDELNNPTPLPGDY